MNIHVARTPHFRTRFTHTCCQGQTGSLTVRPDTARWEYTANVNIAVNLQRVTDLEFRQWSVRATRQRTFRYMDHVCGTQNLDRSAA